MFFGMGIGVCGLFFRVCCINLIYVGLVVLVLFLMLIMVLFI